MASVSFFFENICKYHVNVKSLNSFPTNDELKDKNKIVAATLLLSKKIKMFKTMFYAPRGFLLDYNDLDLLKEFTIKVKEFIKSKDALFLKINPYVDYQLRNVDGVEIENTKNDVLMNKLRELGFIHNGFYIDQDKKKEVM